MISDIEELINTIDPNQLQCSCCKIWTKIKTKDGKITMNAQSIQQFNLCIFCFNQTPVKKRKPKYFT